MALFFENALSFPTAIFSVLLIVVIFYLMLAALGLFDLDITGHDGLDIDHSHDLTGEGIAGLLTRYQLSGVPLALVISLITLIGWFISYFCVHFGLRHIESGLIRYPLGLAVLFIVLILSIRITAVIIRPLRKVFNKLNLTKHEKNLIGQMVEINSSTVTEQNGWANFDDGGAGMLLRVRASADNQFKRGDRAIIISYDDINHTYQVISEDEFNGFK